MTREVCFLVEADASSGLLCRLLGLFAQLDLPAPSMRVEIAGTSMSVEANLLHFGDALVPTVARKMAGFVGVRAVEIHASDDRERGRRLDFGQRYGGIDFLDTRKL